jgi:hypothetical protein
MDTKYKFELKEVIFGSKENNNRIQKLLKDGIIRKISSRIYTTNFDEKPEEIIKRNILEIIGNLFPNSILSHRSAFEFEPTKDNYIFVTHKYTKLLKLPGITISFIKGNGPIKGDNRFIGELFVSQKPRAFLENMQISKGLGDKNKTLPIPLIEEKLDKIITVNGEKGINDLRDEAKKIASKLNLKKEYEKLNRIISALLSTKPNKYLNSEIGIARALKAPFDKNRIELLKILFNELSNGEYESIPDKNKTTESFRNFAFFESYFSNYIEGTVFTVEEAKKIIDTKKPMPSRDHDSHDVLGTYLLASNREGMKEVPNTPDELIDILKRRHTILLSSRANMNPGEFKEINNQAGNTLFVDYSLVRGTLIKGFEFYNILEGSFRKAAYMMFLISEIHPFLDGNGRIARIMMNAEFVKNGESKIIIPTVFREDYLLSLRKLSRSKDPNAYIEMFSKAHKFSGGIHSNNYDEMYSNLKSRNAFYEPDEGKYLKIIE